MTVLVEIILMIVALYFFAGILFAIFFSIKGIQKVDPSTHGSGLGFRIIIIPGVVTLWPVLLIKWIKAKQASYDKAIT
jgi:hypothetical protein